MLNTKKLLTKILTWITSAHQERYVITTSGNWTCRKYNNGLLEAWYSTTGSLTIGTQVGSIYQTASDSSITPPTIATSVAYACVNINTAAFGAWTYLTGVSETAIKYRAVSGATRTSTSFGIRAYMFGRWD